MICYIKKKLMTIKNDRFPFNMLKSHISALLEQKKIRILVEGPPLCGKTSIILSAL